MNLKQRFHLADIRAQYTPPLHAFLDQVDIQAILGTLLHVTARPTTNGFSLFWPLTCALAGGAEKTTSSRIQTFCLAKEEIEIGLGLKYRHDLEGEMGRQRGDGRDWDSLDGLRGT